MAGAGPSLAEGGGLWLGAACLAQEESKAQKDFTESYYVLVGMAPTSSKFRATFGNDSNTDSTSTLKGTQ